MSILNLLVGKMADIDTIFDHKCGNVGSERAQTSKVGLAYHDVAIDHLSEAMLQRGNLIRRSACVRATPKTGLAAAVLPHQVRLDVVPIADNYCGVARCANQREISCEVNTFDLDHVEFT